MNMSQFANALRNNQLQLNRRTANVGRATGVCQRIRRRAVSERNRKQRERQMRALRQIMSDPHVKRNNNMGRRPTRSCTRPQRLTYQVASKPAAKRKQKAVQKAALSVQTKACKKPSSKSKLTPAQIAKGTIERRKKLRENYNSSGLNELMKSWKM